jgi:hypothetical protein
MGIRDSLKRSLTDYLSPSILKPALAVAGITAARLDYDPQSRQVVLAIQIHGKTRFAYAPTGRTLTLAQICELLDAEPPADQAESPPPIGGAAEIAPQPPP